VDEQLGTIEEGKIANILVCEGKLFDEKSKFKYVFVDGEKIEIEKKEKKERKEGEETGEITVSGTWEMSIDTPDMVISATLEINESEGTITGTWSSEMGEAEIENGKISGNEIEFRILVGGIEALFTGTVEGSEMSGTVDAGEMGTATWKASKEPGSE